MKKILIIFILVILNFSTLCSQNAYCRNTPAESEANAYCVKGDKILDYYEKLEDKSNPDKYLNAAKYYYYQASRLDLSNANALVGHARVALYQNRLKDAKNVLMIALNFNEINPRVNYYLGETFYREGEYTQAIDFYNQAYSHGYRYDYNTNYKLGISYEKMDDVKMAKYHYKNAIKLRPNSIDAAARLGGLDTIKTDYENFNIFQDSTTGEEEETITDEDLKNLNLPSFETKSHW